MSKIQYFSQKKQDEWVINNVFNRKRNGYFIEAGALDGISNSNTYTLEKYLHWRGILIEPNPKMYKKLIGSRLSICVNAALVNKSRIVKFRIDKKIPGHSNIVGAKYKQNNYIYVKGISLIDLLHKYNAPKIIEYFSLDVEGKEEFILKNFDFGKYIFLALTIENSTSIINSMLFKHGYIFIKDYKRDTFCVHKSIINKINF